MPRARKNNARLNASLFVFPLLLPLPASAAEPALAATIWSSLPWMLITILPITAIEAVVLQLSLKGALGRKVKAVLIANFWSTLLGIPVIASIPFLLGDSIAGLLAAAAAGETGKIIEFALAVNRPTEASGLPYDIQLLLGLVAVAAIYFAALWMIETHVLQRRLGGSRAISKVVLAANCVSLAALTLFSLASWAIN